MVMLQVNISESQAVSKFVAALCIVVVTWVSTAVFLLTGICKGTLNVAVVRK